MHANDEFCHMCKAFTRSNAARTDCISDNCAHNQILTKTGHCDNCRPYHRANEKGNKCIKPRCNPDEILALNGACLKCPQGMQPVTDGRHCGYSSQWRYHGSDSAGGSGRHTVTRRTGGTGGTTVVTGGTTTVITGGTTGGSHMTGG